MFKFSFLYQLKQLQIDDSHSTLLKMLSELLNCTQQMSLRTQDLTSLSLIKYSCTELALLLGKLSVLQLQQPLTDPLKEAKNLFLCILYLNIYG